jgi:ribonuclease P protein component
VARNRARRRVREAVRLVYDQIAPGWDLVFILRSPALTTVDFGRLRSLVAQLLQRAGAWHGIPPAAPPQK